MKKLYGGIDLHANNSVIVILDDDDQIVYRKRVPNELETILPQLTPYRPALQGVVVESTYNWYWLVDGLMEAGYPVQLANPAAMHRYDGLKHTDDHTDARWLAHLLRLGLLPTGYIYPKEERAVRDLLRKRGQLVRQQTTNVLSLQSLLLRQTGTTLSSARIKRLRVEEVPSLVAGAEVALAFTATLRVLRSLAEQIREIEVAVKARVAGQPAFQLLQTVRGIGELLALTILLETGDIQRFATVGQFASYCRCVSSTKLSNGKRKGRGNAKNGNKYLGWAFVEAAHFAVQWDPHVRRFYQRKKAKTHAFVASKAVAHKLARACYYMLRDHVPFEVHKTFAV